MRTAYITGRLGKDPETFAPNGSDYSVIKFSIANGDESKKNAQVGYDTVTSWYDIEFWTKNPQPWLQKLLKGVEVALECTIKQDKWEKDGQNYSKIKFVVNRFPVVCGRIEEKSAPQSKPPSGFPGPEQFDDDIPF